jgi:hypothetical protein
MQNAKAQLLFFGIMRHVDKAFLATYQVGTAGPTNIDKRSVRDIIGDAGCVAGNFCGIFVFVFVFVVTL